MSKYIITFLVVVEGNYTSSSTTSITITTVLSSTEMLHLVATCSHTPTMLAMEVVVMVYSTICPRHHHDGKCISTTRPDIMRMEMERSDGEVRWSSRW